MRSVWERVGGLEQLIRKQVYRVANQESRILEWPIREQTNQNSPCNLKVLDVFVGTNQTTATPFMK